MMIFLGLILAALPTNTLRADEFDRFKTTTRLFVEAADFYWDERIDGSKVLDEKGILYGVGLAVSDVCTASKSFKPDLYRLTFGGHFKYTFGTVDYDGQTQNGTPAQTDVNYSGFTLEAYLGGLFKTASPTWFVEPKLALGYRNWSRDLQSTAQAIGYKESWQTLYSRIGATGTFFFQENYRLDLSGGAIVPLWAANDADLGIEISLSPKPYQPTPYAEVAVQYKKVGLALYFEAFRFGKSDVVMVTEAVGAYQPESYEEKVGARLSVAFY
jgi:hypothetical protein